MLISVALLPGLAIFPAENFTSCSKTGRFISFSSFFFSVPLEDGFISKLILYYMPSQRSFRDGGINSLLFRLNLFESSLFSMEFRENSAASATNAAIIQTGFRSLIRKKTKKKELLSQKRKQFPSIFTHELMDVGARRVERDRIQFAQTSRYSPLKQRPRINHLLIVNKRQLKCRFAFSCKLMTGSLG